MSETTPNETVRPRLVDWLVTPPFLLAFVGTLLVFDPVQRIARLFGQRPQEIAAGLLQVVPCAFRNRRHAPRRGARPRRAPGRALPRDRESPEHVRHPDLRRAAVPQPSQYISKRELAKWLPSISYNLRRGGHAIIDRDDRAGAVKAIRALAAQVRERGVTAVIFPEGTRARRGELGAFKTAGALALFEEAPDVPVVAVAIDRSWQILRFNLLPIPCTRVHVRIGAPIERRAGEDRAALLGEARAQIEKALARWRAVAHLKRYSRARSFNAAPASEPWGIRPSRPAPPRAVRAGSRVRTCRAGRNASRAPRGIPAGTAARGSSGSGTLPRGA